MQYPSKSLNKWLHGTYQNIGKAQAHGVGSRMATAVMNCPPMRNCKKKVMKEVLDEISDKGSKKTLAWVRRI